MNERMTANAVEPFRVVFVCTGNICRSPMAEVVFRALADSAGVGDRVLSTSAGTGDCRAARQSGDGFRPEGATAAPDGARRSETHSSPSSADVALRSE